MREHSSVHCLSRAVEGSRSDCSWLPPSAFHHAPLSSFLLLRHLILTAHVVPAATPPVPKYSSADPPKQTDDAGAKKHGGGCCSKILKLLCYLIVLLAVAAGATVGLATQGIAIVPFPIPVGVSTACTVAAKISARGAGGCMAPAAAATRPPVLLVPPPCITFTESAMRTHSKQSYRPHATCECPANGLWTLTVCCAPRRASNFFSSTPRNRAAKICLGSLMSTCSA